VLWLAALYHPFYEKTLWSFFVHKPEHEPSQKLRDSTEILQCLTFRAGIYDIINFNYLTKQQIHTLFFFSLLYSSTTKQNSNNYLLHLVVFVF
jgi:hypothetical protein